MSRREAKTPEKADAGSKKKRRKGSEAPEANAAPAVEQEAASAEGEGEAPVELPSSNEPETEVALSASAEAETAAAAEASEVDAPVDDAIASEASEDADAEVLPDNGAAQVAIADMPREEQKKLIESLIFVSDRPLPAQQLGRMLKLRSALVIELAQELVVEYQGRGIEIAELSGGYQFRSAASSAHVVRTHIAQPPVRLTRAQLETLALVAYRQPITRPEIDDVRGVDSGSALRVLLERGLLKMLGRKDEPGRPLLYGTTPFFLDFFGMRSLKDLPTLREFTELSDENRALFKRKTGESIEDAEAALIAAADAAQEEVAVAEAEETTEAGTSTLEAAPDEEGHAPPDGEPEPEAAHSVEGHDEGDGIDGGGEIDRAEAAQAEAEEASADGGEPETTF